VVLGLKVSAGHDTHADWLTSSLKKPGAKGWQKNAPAAPRAKWKPAWQRHSSTAARPGAAELFAGHAVGSTEPTGQKWSAAHSKHASSACARLNEPGAHASHGRAWSSGAGGAGGGGKLGFEKPGSHTHALTFALPAASVSECATQRAQLAFASTSL
jgi:hypothetical protein